MKTLDEVIKAYEYCIDNNYRDCRGCPYGCEDGESGCHDAEEKKDALHYLKEYQKIEDEYEELKDWWAEEHAENVPLSWDELRLMKGKPVWWAHGEVGEWLTIYCVPSLGNGNDNVIYATTCSGVECWIWRTDLDKFQYYRNEVKENMFHEDAG